MLVQTENVSKMTVFWQFFPCIIEKLIDVSEVLTTSIIALMMEAVSIIETSADFYETIRRNVPEDTHTAAIIS
jgi:hypothetical protein